MSRTSLAALWGAVSLTSAQAGAQIQAAAVIPTPPTVGAATVTPVASAPPAPAEPIRMRFAWARGEGAERCPDASVIDRAVATRLDRAPFSADAAQSVEAFVHRDGPRWVARIFLRDRDGALLGERTLHSDDPACEALIAPVSLALALAIDPEATLRPLPDPAVVSARDARPAVPVVPVVPVRPIPPARPRPARPSPPVPSRPELALSLGAWTTAGLLPGWTPGLSLDASARGTGRFGAFVSARWLPERPLDPQANPTRFGLSALAFGPEVSLWSNPRARVSAVTGPAFGAVHAVVFSLAPAEPGERVFASWLAGARASVDLWGPFGAALGVEAWVPLTRYVYRDPTRSSEPVFEQSFVGASGWLAFGARFR
jgi:hypothetical protein